jgi:hypothetical protein
MSLDHGLSDTLLFEIPDRAGAEHLSKRLRSRWIEWLQDRDGLWFVAVLLRPLPGDLAVLLREVETWAAERGLDELWFHLDRRSYLLRVADAAAAAA